MAQGRIGTGLGGDIGAKLHAISPLASPRFPQ